VFDDLRAADGVMLRIFRVFVSEIHALQTPNINVLFSTHCEILASEGTPVYFMLLPLQEDVAVNVFLVRG